ncbi:MAG: hypothetical protein ACOZAJ_03145 [Patescibacteria group bacterium]
MLEKIKRLAWKLFEPVFPSVRDLWVHLGFIKHNSRQPYLIGQLKSGLTEKDLRQKLTAAGFSNDYLAWIDPDEILNMRKVVNIIYQYHIRLFLDGEIRGHYEYTAESHPFKHLYDKDMSDGRDYLYPLIQDLLELPMAKSNPK